MSLNTLPIEIKTLTPIHIGTGVELQHNYEYVYFAAERQIAVLDERKVQALIGKEHIDHWVAAIDQGLNILEHLPQLHGAKAVDLAQRVIAIASKTPSDGPASIKAQIHLGNQEPCIPGSSLKGAIRTAILTYLIKKDSSFAQDERNLGSRRDFHARQIEANYLGRKDRPNRDGELEQSPNKDLMRFLRVGDAYFSGETTLVKNTIINLFQHGWGEKKEESSYYECIPAGLTSTGSLQIPHELLNLVQQKGYIRNGHFDLLAPKRLFKLINAHTQHLLKNEIDFWNEEEDPIALGDYLEHLNQLQETIASCDEHSCILRVGASSGWDFMTGAWSAGLDVMGDDILAYDTWLELKRDIRKPKNYPDDMVFPKTRKLIEGGEPLGFVKIKLN